MCVMYVSFGSKVRPRTFGCVAMGSAVLFISRSRLLLYSAGSGVPVLSGFTVGLICFVQVNTLCGYGCIYFSCTGACVYRCDFDVVCIGHDLNRCSGCGVLLLLLVYSPFSDTVGLPLHNIPFISFCHGHLRCRSQLLPYPLLHSLTMSFLVVQPVLCLQL